MANPQIENGHTRIANELMDQLGHLRISGNQFRILVVIIRKTYGFQKKIDKIANVQICEATGLGKSVVSRAMAELKERGIITASGKSVGIQKDWELWKVSKIATFNEVSNSATFKAKVSKSGNSEKLAKAEPKLAKAEQKVDSCADTQKKKETLKKTIKKEYGEFQNVLLTDEELSKLRQRFPAEVDSLIEQLSCYIKSKGKKYNSHYATLLNWQRMSKERRSGTNRNPRDLPATYTRLPEQDEDD